MARKRYKPEEIVAKLRQVDACAPLRCRRCLAMIVPERLEAVCRCLAPGRRTADHFRRCR